MVTRRVIVLIHHLLTDDFWIDDETFTLLLDLLPLEGQDNLKGLTKRTSDNNIILNDETITIEDFERLLYAQ